MYNLCTAFESSGREDILFFQRLKLPLLFLKVKANSLINKVDWDLAPNNQRAKFR